MADFTGDAGPNIFTGGSDPDTANGKAGDDQLTGNGGSDKLIGEAGSDTMDGGDGDDQLFSHTVDPAWPGFINRGVSYDIYAEADVLSGGAGDDYIFAGYGDTIDGGTSGSFGNRLYISFLGATSGVTADFRLLHTQATMTVGATTISNIQNIGYLEGSDYDDFLVPIDTYYPSGANVYGRGGNDHLIADYYSGWAGGGLYGGDGDDIVDGRPAQYGPTVYGDAGNDLLYNNGAAYGGTGNDTIHASGGYGEDGNDTIYASAVGYGGAGDDLIIIGGGGFFVSASEGNDGNDEIRASATGNSISGGAGADLLTGSDGNDTLVSADFVPNTVTAAADMGLEQDLLTGGGGNDTLAIGYGDSADGGAGSDTLRLSLGGLASGVTFDTAGIVAGQPYVLGGGTIQNVETLEYLRGTDFADTLTAATQAILLTLDAGDGNDVIVTSSSSVSANGGNGNDRFVSGAAGDIFNGGAGTDIVDYASYASGVTVSLGLEAGQTGTGGGGDQLVSIEVVYGSASADTLNGSNAADTLLGNGGNDTLNGNGGNDTLIGGDGNDALTGGLGDDVYFVDAAGDTVSENAGQGTDRVIASLSFALAAGASIETLETTSYTGTGAIDLTGNAIAQTIYGNNGVNALLGEGGDDLLHGFAGADYLVGGTGLDNMYGGAGDDRYYIGSADGDRVWEVAGEGYDTVSTEVDYTLPDTADVERLEAGTLTATSALQLGGSNLDNLIIGNMGDNRLRGFAGDDTLHGLGGDDYLIGDEGADTMYGGAGNDTYYVNTSDDRIFENVGEGGNDRVATEVSFTLPYEAEVEVLEAVNLGGTSIGELGGSGYANTITGDAGNNLIRGYAGNDTLSGHLGNDMLIGDEGADTMHGGAGDDVYFVDAAGDQVFEEAGQGNDRVATGVSYALSASAEVETLETTSVAGTDAIDLTGSDTANLIVGNAGANWIDGKGGNDVLVGAGGADTFAFTSALGSGNVDTVEGFTPGSDRIALDDAILTDLNPGSMDPNRFATGSTAGDADDRIIFDSSTGALYFDADGNGAGAAVQIASLAAGLDLASTDLLIV